MTKSISQLHPSVKCLLWDPPPNTLPLIQGQRHEVDWKEHRIGAQKPSVKSVQLATQINLFMKQKQTHKHGKQIHGYQRGQQGREG